MSTYQIKKVITTTTTTTQPDLSHNSLLNNSGNTDSHITISYNLISSCISEVVNRCMDATEYVIIYGKKSKEHTYLTITYLVLFAIIVVYIMFKIRVFK
jgi:hypothetical protein